RRRREPWRRRRRQSRLRQLEPRRRQCSRESVERLAQQRVQRCELESRIAARDESRPVEPALDGVIGWPRRRRRTAGFQTLTARRRRWRTAALRRAIMTLASNGRRLAA